MSLEIKQEKQEIEVTVKYLKCDLCETRIPPNTPMITLKVSAAYKNMDMSLRTKREFGEIDVCSTSCLRKNVGGAELILDTHMMPEAQRELDNPSPEKQAETSNQLDLDPGTIYNPSNTYTVSYGGTTSSDMTISNSPIKGTASTATASLDVRDKYQA